jgi:Glycosyl transferase family 2
MPRPADWLVSVVIPNYNHARYVADAIRSVLAQTYRCYEIIVVDDGSTDDSRAVVAGFGDRVTCIHQPNAGLSAARNTGIRASTGSLIGVLDADDLYEPEYLEVLVSALREHPDAGGVHCGYRFVDDQNRPLPQVEARALEPDALHRALLDGNFLVPESILLRKSVYDDVGVFDEALRACEDWDVWLRAAARHRIIHAPRVLTRHRVLPGSMSTDPERMLTSRLAVLAKHVGAEPTAAGTSEAHRAFGRAYLGSSVEFLQYGDSERAYRCLRQMATTCPNLLREIDTGYQLGCGRQPKGSMGDLTSVTVPSDGAPLLPMLDRLFADRAIQEPVRCQRRPAYATALAALGILAYNTGDSASARRFLSLALAHDRSAWTDGSILRTWARSLVGRRLVDLVKGASRRMP